jgi:PPP family 3-phenylpropionic acid transporter
MTMPFALRVTLLYSSVFAAIGIQMPFLPIWLAANGLDAPTIGAVLAASTAARVLAVPFGTRAADRFVGLRAAILLAFLASAASFTLVGLASGVTMLFATCVLAAAAGGTALPLIETYALHGLAARGRAYGPVRGWGSVAFIAGNLGAGALITVMAPAHFIWVIVAAYWAGVATAIALPAVATGAAVRPSQEGGEIVARPRGLVAVIAASALIQASHAVFYVFGTLQWAAAGLDGVAIGALWALSVAAEIVLFAASARFSPAFGSLALLALGGAGAALRWAAMALDPPLPALPALQCLHALSFGATHLGAVQFVARAARPGRAAATQGWLTLANGALMAAAMAVAGLTYAPFGSAAYVPMALLGLGGGVIAFATLLRQRPAT